MREHVYRALGNNLVEREKLMVKVWETMFTEIPEKVKRVWSPAQIMKNFSFYNRENKGLGIRNGNGLYFTSTVPHVCRQALWHERLTFPSPKFLFFAFLPLRHLPNIWSPCVPPVTSVPHVASSSGTLSLGRGLPSMFHHGSPKENTFQKSFWTGILRMRLLCGGGLSHWKSLPPFYNFGEGVGMRCSPLPSILRVRLRPPQGEKSPSSNVQNCSRSQGEITFSLVSFWVGSCFWYHQNGRISKPEIWFISLEKRSQED